MFESEKFKTHMSGEEVEVIVVEAMTKIMSVECPRCKKSYVANVQIFRGQVPDEELEELSTEKTRDAFEALKEAVEACEHTLEHLKDDSKETS